MKALSRASTLSIVVLGGILCGPAKLCRAQVLVVGGGNQTETLVPLSSVPSGGTFWSAGNNLPPAPFYPLPQLLPLYAYLLASNEVYVYDDRYFDYAAYWAGNASTNSGGMLPMDESGPPSPPGGLGTNGSGGGPGPSYPHPDFTTNDLWLEIDGVANQTAALVIHPRWYVTNGVYDLFFTTNLAPPTSWQWVMRTAPGQTNLYPTNATGVQGFYRVALVNPSAGTDFWVAFTAGETYDENTLTLYVSSQFSSSGTVSSAGLGFTNSFTLLPGAVTNLDIPDSAMMRIYDSVATNGIHVTASQPVSVYGIVYLGAASTAFTGHPTPMLGTNYCVLARPSDDPYEGYYWSEFAILGTESNTTVTIRPSPTANLTNHPGTNSYTETLQPGETYQINCISYTNDLTGTWITSDEPIAVFAGANGAYVPDANTCCANPLEQEQQPVSEWGNQALALSFGRPGGDSYRVLAASSNTIVTINGVFATNLAAGQPYDTILAGPVEFQGSNPIQVAQFAQGGDTDGTLGDPCEILLPTTGHYLTSYTIVVLPYDYENGDFTTNFVNVIVPQSAIPTTLLNGSAVAAANYVAIGASGYSAARVPVAAVPNALNSYTITSSQPVEVEVYGFGQYDAYGYIGGLTASP